MIRKPNIKFNDMDVNRLSFYSMPRISNLNSEMSHQKNEESGKMSATEAHLRILLAKRENDKSYYHPSEKSFAHILDHFIENYVNEGMPAVSTRIIRAKNAKERSASIDPEKFKTIVKKIVSNEIADEDWLISYSGMSRVHAFAMDILAEFRRQEMAKKPGEIVNFKHIWEKNWPKTSASVRSMDHLIESKLQQFKNWKGSPEEKLKKMREAFFFRNYRHQAICANFALFGSHGHELEYTLNYWINNFSAHIKEIQSSGIIAEVIEEILQRKFPHLADAISDEGFIEESELMDECYAIYEEELKDCVSNNQGRLLAISVHPEVANKVLSIGCQVPYVLNFDEKETYQPSILLDRLRKDPANFEKKALKSYPLEIKNLSFVKTQKIKDKESATNRFFSIFFVAPDLVYDTNKVKTRKYDLFFQNDEHQKRYYQRITDFVTKVLALSEKDISEVLAIEKTDSESEWDID